MDIVDQSDSHQMVEEKGTADWGAQGLPRGTIQP